MSILLGKQTRVIVQGITGRDGSFHARSMKEYGTTVVGGVTPGQGRTGCRGSPRVQHRGRGGGQDRR